MRSLACLLLASLTLAGADLSGIWVGQIPGRNGDTDVAFQFKQEGSTLSGKLYGDYASTAITDGKVTGDEFVFVVEAQEQAGNQINEARLRFTGVVKNGQIEITREREGARNAGNGGVTQFRGNTKTAFKLKRLL